MSKSVYEGYKPAYAVKDEMVGFGSPMIYENNQVAIRDFASAVKDVDSVMSKWKNDYALYRIGQYNNEYGYFIAEDEPVLIIRARSIVLEEDYNEGKE